MLETPRSEIRSRLRKLVDLSWPIVIDQYLQTLMRTVDILVTGLISPVAVAAVGIADVFARLPLFMGLGFGGGTIALVSQDTGGDALANRDEALSQALLVGTAIGLPFVLFGHLFATDAISLLGASEEVAVTGGTYLAIVLTGSPARHVSLISIRALQGTGDTRTPMVVRGVSNLLNIVGSITLGLGIGIIPQLGVLGVGIATATAHFLNATVFLLLFASSKTDINLQRPQDTVITRQLVSLSTPRIAEGWATVVAEFPFNAILLLFGTEVVAGYHVGVRIYKQLTGPFNRSFKTASSIIVGQIVGQGDIDEARKMAWFIISFSVGFTGIFAAAMVLAPSMLAGIFTQDEATLVYAIGFTQVYGFATPFDTLLRTFSGVLRGGSDTRTPFYARASGIYLFMVGGSYLFGVVFGYGLLAVYISIVLYFAWAAAVVAVAFKRGKWSDRALDMMEDRQPSTP